MERNLIVKMFFGYIDREVHMDISMIDAMMELHTRFCRDLLPWLNRNSLWLDGQHKLNWTKCHG